MNGDFSNYIPLDCCNALMVITRYVTFRVYIKILCLTTIQLGRDDQATNSLVCVSQKSRDSPQPSGAGCKERLAYCASLVDQCHTSSFGPAAGSLCAERDCKKLSI